MADGKKNPGQLVFGLDIGTRSIVGTVGYKTEDVFHVVAQEVIEHDTRSMIDGQIHDIEMVGKTISEVKERLERKLNKELNEVCIAAAGRVLKTKTTNAEITFSEDTVVDAENIYTLEMLGVEKAYEEFVEKNETGMKFYCVGYTVVKYFLNDYPMSSLDKHKARKIAVELIATFLPDEVVDGLYKAVDIAGLQVANLTLEPIAAMQAAVPVMYRMLNIALVDVGAGTSDISITKDGSIIAYGMIPSAGDELTETICKHYLVDFKEAEMIKIASGKKSPIKFTDIMGLVQKTTPEDVHRVVSDVVKSMTKDIADKIKELNGGKSVSAVFVVGGGGIIEGFTDNIAKELGIAKERVALRGEEVLKNIDFLTDEAGRDSLFVTPIGICLNFYDQKNNFIFVNFNGKRVKLYDNGHLMVADAAIQAGFPNEGLFPRRGKELNFTINGKPRMIRGDLGEPAVVKVNGQDVSINSPIQAGDKIRVKESTAGKDAKIDVGNLPEYESTIQIVVNDKKVVLPKFAQVNGKLQSEYYNIQNNDIIKMLNFYTVKQITEFMDVILKKDMNIYVNNKLADLDTLVYENFNVIWTMEELKLSDVSEEPISYADLPEDDMTDEEAAPENSEVAATEAVVSDEEKTDETKEEQEQVQNDITSSGPEVGMTVIVNNQSVHLTGKKSYIYVDVFDYIDFDLSKPQGKEVATLLNGRNAQYTEYLHSGDRLDIFWK